MIQLKTIISEQTDQIDLVVPNVLFVGDFEIKDRNSFAKKLLASRKVTGEIKFSQYGNTDRLLEILQSNLAENYNVVMFFSSGQFESLEYNETLENLNIAIDECRRLEIPIILFTFPDYTFKKDKEQQDEYKKLSVQLDKINDWLRRSSNADYVVDLDLRADDAKTFFNADGTKISSDGHNLILRKLQPILRRLDIDVDIEIIQPKTDNKLIKGAALLKLQNLLIKLGYNINKKELRKNDFGPSTQEALRVFQLKNGLLPTGEIDLNTIKRLKSANAIPFGVIGAATTVNAIATKDVRNIEIRRQRRMTGDIDTNKQVFLDAIAFAEGTDQYPNDGYYTLFTGKQFDSLDAHPNILICANTKAGKICSTAAGRYQFLYSSWTPLNFSDFSADNQDQAVFEIISDTTLRAIEEGDWETVFTSANNIWASFPGDVYGQGAKSMDTMLDFVEKRIKELGGEVQEVDDEGNLLDDFGNVIATAGAIGAGLISTIDYSHKLEYNPSSGFKTAARPDHEGVDYHASKGTPVVLAQGGKVIATKSGCSDDHDAKGNPVYPKCGGGWGNFVKIKFKDGAIGLFAHFTTVNVSDGSEVDAGTVIGTVGDTGHSYGAHLHFEYHPVGTYKAAGTPEIAKNYFGFGSGGTEKPYVSPNTTNISATKKTKSAASKSIVIGDSLCPYVEWGTGNVVKQHPTLCSSGKGSSWLNSKVADTKMDTSVKNVVIQIGTNDIYNASSPISQLVSNIRLTFPAAKLFVVQGTYGSKVNWSKALVGITDKQVKTYYNKFADMGVIVISPAIGNLPDAHGRHEIYKTIGANIVSKLK